MSLKRVKRVRNGLGDGYSGGLGRVLGGELGGMSLERAKRARKGFKGAIGEGVAGIIHRGRCRTVRARCAHGACTVRARFNVFGMVAQLVPR